jgi:TctA family transporter
MLEENLRQSLIISGGSFAVFFARPIAATLIAVSVVLLLLPMLMKKPAFDVSDCERAAFRMHKGVARASCLSFTRVAPI